jgi:hypothetical protein
MKRILFVAACLLLVSCKAMKGDLIINEDITLLKKKSIFSSKMEKVKIPEGSYKASLKGTSKKKFKLKIKDVNGKELSIPFVIPKGTTLPAYEGELTLSKKQTKQPYDLVIAVSTDSRSSQYTSHESCVSHYTYQTVCHWVSASTQCHDEGGHRVCRTKPSGDEVCYTTSTRRVCSTTPGYQDCNEVSTPVYGSQEVTYDSTTTTKSLVARLKDVENIKASFDHQDSKTNRSRIGATACY